MAIKKNLSVVKYVREGPICNYEPNEVKIELTHGSIVFYFSLTTAAADIIYTHLSTLDHWALKARQGLNVINLF